MFIVNDQWSEENLERKKEMDKLRVNILDNLLTPVVPKK